MATYNFPDITPTSQSFELVTNTKQFQSPLSNAIQTVSRKGSYWKTTMRFSNLTGAQRSELQAFIAKLDGQTHRMRIRDYGQPFRGNAPSSDSVTVSSTLPNRVVITGCSVSIGSYLKRGDYIQIGNQIYQATHGTGGDNSDPISNSGGTCGIYIAPNFITEPAQGTAVTLQGATGVFMLSNNPKWTTTAPYFSSITIEAISDVLA
jgi:hypothetical protein